LGEIGEKGGKGIVEKDWKRDWRKGQEKEIGEKSRNRDWRKGRE
jgi:hypothetical protein